MHIKQRSQSRVIAAFLFSFLSVSAFGFTGAPLLVHVRAPSPQEHNHDNYFIDGKSVHMAWHHLISVQDLIQTWNCLVEHQHKSKDHKRALRLFIKTLNLDKELKNEVLRQLSQNIQTISDEHYNQFHSALVWPNWNLVQGPRYRKDDPEYNYDDLRGRNDPTNDLRSKMLKLVNAHNPRTAKNKQIEAAQQLVTALKLIITRDAHLRERLYFDSNQWHQSPADNKWQRSIRSGFMPIHVLQ